MRKRYTDLWDEPFCTSTMREPYVPVEFAPSVRPGAMDASKLPSRVNNRLFWPDGRVEVITNN